MRRHLADVQHRLVANYRAQLYRHRTMQGNTAYAIRTSIGVPTYTAHRSTIHVLWLLPTVGNVTELEYTYV